MPDWFLQPWPWWISGPLIGSFVPALLLLGNRSFGFSANLRHILAAMAPGRIEFFRYDWRRIGGWNLAFLVGTVGGAFLASWLSPDTLQISAATKRDLAQLGIRNFSGLAPADIFSWGELADPRNLALIVLGGLLVGFGTAYAGGCTSGHGVSGLADRQLPSLIAVISFFAGGILATYVLLPLVLR